MPKPPTKTIVCPFTVVIDSSEQRPYTFKGLTADADKKFAPLAIPTVRYSLAVGDYSIQGRESEILIERKSKEDLYGSMSTTEKRENFIARLEVMNAIPWGAVVVEAGWQELIESPPRHTKFAPKSLYRTILFWMQRYPKVHWFPAFSREFAEITTFRLLQCWHRDHETNATVES